MVQKIIQYRQYVYFIEEPKKVLKQITILGLIPT